MRIESAIPAKIRQKAGADSAIHQENYPGQAHDFSQFGAIHVTLDPSRFNPLPLQTYVRRAYRTPGGA